jgi:hypothetical protein
MGRFLRSILATSTATVLSLSSVTYAQNLPAAKVNRPPQFVMLAFDGSFSIDFWKESRAFAQKMRAENKSFAWTYFISGVYWLHEGNYALYVPPHIESNYPTHEEMERDVAARLQFANDPANSKAAKKSARSFWSDIGFGNDVNDVAARLDQVGMAYDEGHEIGSHANGHYVAGTSRADSRKWTLQQWHSEFNQFNNLIFNAYQNNGIENHTRYSSGYPFRQADIVGFRAPALDTSPAMFQTLVDFNFTYDTSGLKSCAEEPTKWPSKNNLGTWVFPLGYIQLAGTNKSIASMDYNFYFVQSHEKDDSANKDKYRDQMYDSYMKYFNDNYYGNRAPVNIGHHFSKWNGGAYWEAMQHFASEVCGKPEVRCVTYSQYVDWLNTEGPDKIKNYKAGNFDMLVRPASWKSLPPVGGTQPKLTLENGVFTASAQMDGLSKELKYRVALKVDNKLISSPQISLRELRASVEPGSKMVVSAVVLNPKGDEINSYSLKIKGLGTSQEAVDSTPLEDRAALIDPPEAHEHE